MIPLHKQPATALRDAIRTGDVRAEDVTEAILERIRAADGAIGAFLEVYEEPARQQALAVDRKIKQGTRGETGHRWCERIWTVLATCAQQGRSAFDSLYESIVAYFRNQASPCLLPLPL